MRFLDFENNPLRNETNENEKEKIVEQYIQVQNNIAQVNLNLKRYDLCLNAIGNVLKYDPKNIKALFRQGKSFFELGNYSQAIQSLKLLLQLQNNHQEREFILKMIQISEEKIAKYQQNEKEIYQRMFQSSNNKTSTSSQSSSEKTSQQIQQVLFHRFFSSTFISSRNLRRHHRHHRPSPVQCGPILALEVLF